MRDGDKDTKIANWGNSCLLGISRVMRDGKTILAPSATLALSFTGSCWPPSNSVALHRIRLVSSLSLSLLLCREREREQRGRPLWPPALRIEREGAEEGMRKMLTMAHRSRER